MGPNIRVDNTQLQRMEKVLTDITQAINASTEVMKRLADIQERATRGVTIDIPGASDGPS